MGIIVPNILQVADMPHLAALVAPRRMSIASGMNTAGHAVAGEPLAGAFSFTRSIYALLGQERNLTMGLKGPFPGQL